MLRVRGGYFSTEKIGFINPTRVFKLTIVSHGLVICTKFGVILSLFMHVCARRCACVCVYASPISNTRGEIYTFLNYKSPFE